jgi:hypothetical protein
MFSQLSVSARGWYVLLCDYPATRTPNAMRVTQPAASAIKLCARASDFPRVSRSSSPPVTPREPGFSGVATGKT